MTRSGPSDRITIARTTESKASAIDANADDCSEMEVELCNGR